MNLNYGPISQKRNLYSPNASQKSNMLISEQGATKDTSTWQPKQLSQFQESVNSLSRPAKVRLSINSRNQLKPVEGFVYMMLTCNSPEKPLSTSHFRPLNLYCICFRRLVNQDFVDLMKVSLSSILSIKYNENQSLSISIDSSQQSDIELGQTMTLNIQVVPSIATKN